MKKFMCLSIMTASGFAMAAQNGLTADSLLLSEKLPNGFSVCVYPNKEPPKRVSMRLAVNRGSLVERADEQGLAHFIEHMAFKGTKNFPAGDMIEYFQRLGMAFGADTNAHTGFEETVYKIDMPDVSEKSLNDGMRLLADYARGVLFDANAIEGERGVILAEKTARDTPEYRQFVAYWELIFKGTPYANRLPIGDEGVIKSAPREKFLDFYAASYRPENMMLCIVGDVDVKEMAKKAAEVFGKLGADQKTPARAEAEVKKIEDKKFEPALREIAENFEGGTYIDAELKNATAEIFVCASPKFSEDCRAERIESVKLSAVAYALTRRLEKISSQKDAKITKGEAGFQDIYSRLDAAFISVDAPSGKSADALAVAATELERALKYGFEASEIAQAKGKIINAAEAALAAKSARQTPALANRLAASFTSKKVFLSPEELLEIAKEALENFDTSAAHALLKERFSKGRPGYFISDAKPLKYKPQELVLAAAAANISAPEKAAEEKFAYDEISGEGKIAEDSSVAELGIRRIVFENGARLNLKKTDFAADNIMVCLDIGGGKLDVPEGKMRLAMLADCAFIASGTGKHSFDELESLFADKTVSAGFEVSEASFKLTGITTKKDFETQLKILRAHLADPGFRADALSKAQKEIDEFYNMLETNPEVVLQAKASQWLLSGDERFGYPAKFEASEKDFAEMRELLTPILQGGYLEISIVGDIDEEAAVKLASKIFGSLPKREKSHKDYSSKMEVKICAEKDKTFEFESRLPRSISLVAWPSCAMSDIDRARSFSILGEILGDVMRKQIREKMGQVYSPFCYNNSNRLYSFGFLYAGSVVDAGGAEKVAQLVKECAKEVSEGFTVDQFERAKLPVLKQIEKMRRQNGYWLASTLSLSQAFPERLEWAKTIVSGYDNVKLEDVQKAAEIFKDAGAPKTIIIKPAKAAGQ